MLHLLLHDLIYSTFASHWRFGGKFSTRAVSSSAENEHDIKLQKSRIGWLHNLHSLTSRYLKAKGFRFKWRTTSLHSNTSQDIGTSGMFNGGCAVHPCIINVRFPFVDFVKCQIKVI